MNESSPSASAEPTWHGRPARDLLQNTGGTPVPQSAVRAWFSAIVLALIVFCSIAPTLTWPDLNGGNEDIVIQTALEMRRGGPPSKNWLVPNMLGEPRVKKPPLVAWITAAAMRPETVAQLDDPATRDAAYHALAWQIRWTGLTAACVMMLATFEIGRLLGGSSIGLCSAVALATNLLFLKYMRQSTSDVHLAMWVAIANAAFVHGVIRKRWWLAATLGAFATGMAFLCKGPVALLETVLPLAVIAVFCRVRPGGPFAASLSAIERSARADPTEDSPRSASATRTMLQLIAGIAIFSAVAVPWFWHVYQTVPNVWHTWFTEVSREGATELQPDSPFTYFELLPMLWPWSIFGVLGVISLAHDRRMRIAFLQIIVPLLIMVWVKDRKERYLLPMLAPAAVLCGAGVVAWWRGSKTVAHWPRWVLLLHVVVLLGGALAFVVIGSHQKTIDNLPWFPPKMVIGAVIVMLSLAGLWAIVQRRWKPAVVGFTMIVMLFQQALFMFGYSQSVSAVSPYKKLAEAIRSLGDVPVHDWIDADRPDKRVDEGLAIYLNRTITRQDPATITGPAVLIAKQYDGKPAPTFPPPWREFAATREKKTLWIAFVKND